MRGLIILLTYSNKMANKEYSKMKYLAYVPGKSSHVVDCSYAFCA